MYLEPTEGLPFLRSVAKQIACAEVGGPTPLGKHLIFLAPEVLYIAELNIQLRLARGRVQGNLHFDHELLLKVDPDKSIFDIILEGYKRPAEIAAVPTGTRTEELASLLREHPEIIRRRTISCVETVIGDHGIRFYTNPYLDLEHA